MAANFISIIHSQQASILSSTSEMRDEMIQILCESSLDLTPRTSRIHKFQTFSKHSRVQSKHTKSKATYCSTDNSSSSVKTRQQLTQELPPPIESQSKWLKEASFVFARGL